MTKKNKNHSEDDVKHNSMKTNTLLNMTFEVKFVRIQDCIWAEFPLFSVRWQKSGGLVLNKEHQTPEQGDCLGTTL